MIKGDLWEYMCNFWPLTSLVVLLGEMEHNHFTIFKHTETSFPLFLNLSLNNTSQWHLLQFYADNAQICIPCSYITVSLQCVIFLKLSANFAAHIGVYFWCPIYLISICRIFFKNLLFRFTSAEMLKKKKVFQGTTRSGFNFILW